VRERNPGAIRDAWEGISDISDQISGSKEATLGTTDACQKVGLRRGLVGGPPPSYGGQAEGGPYTENPKKRGIPRSADSARNDEWWVVVRERNPGANRAAWEGISDISDQISGRKEATLGTTDDCAPRTHVRQRPVGHPRRRSNPGGIPHSADSVRNDEWWGLVRGKRQAAEPARCRRYKGGVAAYLLWSVGYGRREGRRGLGELTQDRGAV